MKPIKPMKGFSVGIVDGEITTPVNYPVLASFKLDGIRAVIQPTDDRPLTALSTSGKPLPSKRCQNLIQIGGLYGLDGEFIYGDPSDEMCFNKTQSAVMSIEWPSDLEPELLRFHTFDNWMHADDAFEDRLESVREICNEFSENGFLQFVDHYLIENDAELLELYAEALEKGYEGLIIRSPSAKYKFGRSTVRENGLGKIKPHNKELFEAEITGWYRQKVYTETTTNAHGYAKILKRKDNFVEIDAIGGFNVRDLKTGIEFNVGGGKLFTKLFRESQFGVADKYVGKILQYTSMTYGVVEKPRQPTAVRMRDKIDMTSY
jgi:DNA ligase-1